jgi:hypothetical protein
MRCDGGDGRLIDKIKYNTVAPVLSCGADAPTPTPQTEQNRTGEEEERES